MAGGFDVRLGLTEGTNRVIEDPANPSAAAAILDFANSALTGYQSIREDQSRAKAKRKAEEEKVSQQNLALEVARSPDLIVSTAAQSAAGQASEVAAVGDYMNKEVAYHSAVFDKAGATGESEFDKLSPFYVPPSDVTPEMEREVTEAARKTANIVTAVQQGRMPEISISAVATARFRQLREKYPAQAEYLIDTWKKMGLDGSTSPEIADAEDERNEMREARQRTVEDSRKRSQEAIAAGRTVLGEMSIGMSDYDLEIVGLRDQRTAHELSRTSQELNLTISRNGIASAESTAAKSTANENFESQYEVAAHNQAAPIVRNIIQLSDAILKDPNNPELMQSWQSMGVKVKQAIPVIASGMVTQAVSLGYTGDKAALQKRIESKYGSLVDLFTGDNSVVSVNVNALKAIQNSVKVETHLALPFMQGLIAAGMKPMDMPGFLKAVDGNPKLQQDLSNEVKGFLQDWGKDKASTRILNAVKILRGETTLARVEPGKVRETVGMVANATTGIAKQYVRGIGGSGEMVVNGVGELVVAARGIHAGSGSQVMAAATNGFASETVRRGVIKALTDPDVEDKDMVRATIQAGRAGNAHLLNGLMLAIPSANKSSPYHKVEWDSSNGRYKIVKTAEFSKMVSKAGFNDAYISKYGANAITPAARASAANMQPPKELTRLMLTANMNLDSAIEYGKHDPSTPKGTDLQLREWYGRNKPLPQEKSSAPVNLVKETQTMIDNMDDILDSQIVNATGKINVPETASAPKDYTKAPRYAEVAPALKQAASKYGVPEKLAFALVGKESTFNPEATGPVIKKGTHKGDRAMGLGQVMGKTAAFYGINREGLDIAGQADLAMRVISDNFKSAGNWKDAVSMYFTGQTYAKAKARGATDGFSTVMAYVEDIL